MRYLLTVFLCVIIAQPMYGQNKKEDETNLIQEDLENLTRGIGRAKSFTEIEGTPYLNNEWQVGRVLLRSGERTEPVMLKYNAYSNKVLFQKNDEVLEVLPNIVGGFILMNDEGDYTYKNGFTHAEEDINKGTILEVLHDGKTKLLAHHYKTISEGSSPGFRTGRVTDRFVDHTKYYLVDSNGAWHEIDFDEDDILDVLEEYRKELLSFAESNDFEFDRKKDIRKILRHYDNLISSSE